MKKIILFLVIFGLFLFFPIKLWADELADVNKELATLEKVLTGLTTESSNLKQQITIAKAQIVSTENKLIDIGKKLIDREADLEVQKILLGERAKRFYINSKKFSPLMIFLGGSGEGDLIKQFWLFQSVMNQDRLAIVNYSTQIVSLNENKKSLEDNKIKIAGIKKTLETKFGYLADEIKKTETKKQELTKRQQSLIAEKTAVFNTSVGDVSTSTDSSSRADYNPGFSPAFALFSFGAPHRKGMSQYGAFGRAKEGKSYEDILKTYYGNIKIEKMDTNRSIVATGIGAIPFEDNYLLGIAEMPASWGDQGGYEALKAQAIAARTYALNSTNNLANPICVTEACQVYSKSRLNSPGKWKQAVEDTRGMVVKSNNTGQIFSTMYASTSGGAIYGYSSNGHSTPQVWDTKCGNQGCWPNEAYEKTAESSWYYKGWYKTRSNLACGKSHPWLNNQEFTDVLNAILYYTKTKDSSRLSQINSGGCFGGNDPDAWSMDELKRQVADKGGPIGSVNSINVDYSTGGYTQNVNISTDKGNFTFSGDDFKEIFVLRAPGAITIKSALFNIEKK